MTTTSTQPRDNTSQLAGQPDAANGLALVRMTIGAMVIVAVVCGVVAFVTLRVTEEDYFAIVTLGVGEDCRRKDEWPDGALPGGVWLCSLATSMSVSTSASMTFSDDFVRSWLRSKRTVSRFASTSSLPPLMKPATSTRWNAVTSILGWIGVSIGIS